MEAIARFWKRWEGLEDYFQAELNCEVLEDSTIPGIITLFAICDCGRMIAKASSGDHDMAFRSLSRQVADKTKCLVCSNAEAAKVVHAERHNHTLNGVTPRRESFAAGIS